MEFVNQLNEAYKDIDLFLTQLPPIEKKEFEKCLYVGRYPMYEMLGDLDWDFFSSNIIVLEYQIKDNDYFNEEEPIDVVSVEDDIQFLNYVQDNIEEGINIVTLGFNYENGEGHQNVMIFYKHEYDIQVLYVEPHGKFMDFIEKKEQELVVNDILTHYVSLFHYLYNSYRSKLKDLIKNEFSLIELLNLQQEIFDPLHLVQNCIDVEDQIDKETMTQFYKDMLEMTYIRELQSQIQYKILNQVKKSLNYLGDLREFNLNNYHFSSDDIDLQNTDSAGYCETVVMINLFLGNLITECHADYCHINPNFEEMPYTEVVKEILYQIENHVNQKNIFTSKLCREGKWLCAFNIFFLLYCVVNDYFENQFYTDKTKENAKEQYDIDYGQNSIIDLNQCNQMLFGRSPMMRYLKSIIDLRVEKIRDALLVDMANMYPKLEQGKKRIRTLEKVSRKKYKFSQN